MCSRALFFTHTRRFAGLVGVLNRPCADDKKAWITTFPGFAPDIFPTGAQVHIFHPEP